MAANSQSEERREPTMEPARGSGKSRKRKKSKGKRRSLVGRAAYWSLVLGLWGFIGAIGVIGWVAAHLPPIQSLEVPKRPPSIQIVGLNGRVLATRGEMGGSAVPLRELPAFLPKAFLAIEDRRFYSHYGIDPFGVARALGANVLHRGVSQGGSTISQQLAKNLFLTQERTMQRKLQEVILALWLERKYSKDEILDLYLNRVYCGNGAYGVEAAAQRYFGKSARNVTLSEAALLAGLVKSPSKLAPTRNFDGAERRAQIVLAAMADAGYVSPDAAKGAIAIAPKIVQQTAGGSINYVADWVMDVLNDVVGHVEQDIVVETTIDPTLQANAEKALLDELIPKGAKFDVEQGAMVVMTPQGAVRALVGGKNYAESQFNRAVAAKRQPGSAFKPFVYLAALERGLTPDTVREDKPIDVKGWKPENYGHEYFGPVSLTKALALSLNTVSVRLTLEVGPQAVVRTAHRLGISSKLEPNASIALGTSEVSVMELVSSYVPFANGGIAVAPHVIDKVRTAGGKLIYRAHNPGLGRVIDERTAAMMNQMMQETLNSGTARKADLAGFPAAGKTGTSQDYRDAWFIGYTGHLIAGVWLGNDDNSATKKLTGGAMPVDIWSRFMKAAHQGLPMADLPGMAGRTIDLTPQAPASPPMMPANPLTSMLSPPHAATPLSREDDARPLVPLAPARPPIALAPPPASAPRAPPPRPQQVIAAPLKQPTPPARSVQPPRQIAAPLPLASAPPPQPQYHPPQRMAAVPASTSSIPRPPGSVGGGAMPEVQPTSNSGVGNFFDNLFGRR
ncbi:MAG: PBP1A family penicillin-binding protein [Alphaproteobacteria bacterium]|nr:MAG: PBP1A family penicillin-binding protein [Alphaproteobacteria bacterium]